MFVSEKDFIHSLNNLSIMTNKATKKQPTKVFIGIRASQTGIDNCKKIAEKTDRTFSYVVSKAMESYKGENV
jgi:hypothetical protein